MSGKDTKILPLTVPKATISQAQLYFITHEIYYNLLTNAREILGTLGINIIKTETFFPEKKKETGYICVVTFEHNKAVPEGTGPRRPSILD